MTKEELYNEDNTFNEAIFLTKVNNIFIKLFTNIMMDRLMETKHFINDEVYNYCESIINKAKAKGCRQMYDELNVKNSQITSIIDKENVYEIKVYLQSRYMDYIIRLDNGSYVSGNNKSRIEVNYELTFTKKKNALKNGIARKCPHCGAPINTNSSGKCLYCDGIYNQSDYDWILTKLEVC